LESILETPPSMLILDYRMPGMQGTELLRRVKRQWDVPAIFLSSRDAGDEVFAGGPIAEDYFTKPFSPRLLVHRVKTILGLNDKENGTKLVTRGKLSLNIDDQSCHCDQKRVSLTLTELLILHALAARPGVVKTRDALMDAAYDDQVYVDDRTIDGHIKRLRKSFKAVDDGFDAIETLYGVGYRFKEV
jgi:two-component system, OmpR family, response regulator ChvI